MVKVKKQAYELAEAILNSHFFEGGRLSNDILERATALKELEEREQENGNPTQDSQSELRETLKDFTYNLKVDTPDGFESKTVVDLEEALYQFEAYVTTRVKEAEAEEVEMAADFAEDVLQQFGYNGKSGGLSTLEWAEGIIKRHKKLQALTTTTNGKAKT